MATAAISSIVGPESDVGANTSPIRVALLECALDPTPHAMRALSNTKLLTSCNVAMAPATDHPSTLDPGRRPTDSTAADPAAQPHHRAKSMRPPILAVLGAFLSVAVFGPFALMFAGPAMTGDPDAAQVGLYLLLHVNPVAIPALLVLLGVAWAFRPRATPPTPSSPEAPAAPRPVVRVCPPAIAASARRPIDRRDVVIDVAAARTDVRPMTVRHPAATALLLRSGHETTMPLLPRTQARRVISIGNSRSS